MRIALVTPGFSADEGDWCIPALLDLVRSLASAHDVHVFALRYPHREGTYTVYGASVHAFGGAETRGVRRFALLQKAIRHMWREHRREPFDVVHAFWADEPGLVATACGRLLRIPTIVSLMGGELVSLPEIQYGGQLSRLNRWMIREALRRASIVTAGSAHLEKMARRHRPSGDLRVQPLGVDTRLFTPYKNPCERELRLQGTPSLLTVGSLVPVKDHDMLLRALSSLTQTLPDVHLHIVGDGYLRSDLERLATSLKLTAHVTFHGEIQHDHLPACFQTADLLVISSRHESQSMVALEAAACGCPVIGTAVGILPELSPISATMLPGDPSALADRITTLVRDKERLGQLAENNLNLAREKYALDRTVQNLLALYTDMLGSRQGSN
jgi:glycosyltransferase involved in cell wall biosynthesis